jgi:DNA processing protein
VEAPASSGALITAGFALEQGRDLWVCAAGQQSEGVVRLADEGAKIIRSASDILEDWGIAERKREPANDDGENSTGKALANALARQLTIES